MGLSFQWDERKAARNLRKHGVTFEEAATVFGDPLLLTRSAPEHSNGEERFFSIGRTVRGRLMAVAHTESGNTIRIISARRATARETRTYEKDKSF